jgi:HD domain
MPRIDVPGQTLTNDSDPADHAKEERSFLSRKPIGTVPLALHLVALTLAGKMREYVRRFGVGVPERFDLADLAVPETTLAHEATEWAEEACPKMLVDHGRRGFLFADAIARHHGERLDRETLYLGCLLHDLGLAQRFDRGNEFERDGADAAVDWLSAHGLSGSRLRLVREIIELHDAPHQASRASAETRFAHYGIGVDVLGVHREDLHQDTLTGIVTAWPRGDFRHEFAGLVKDQAARKPWSHIARLERLGLGALITSAPVPD